MSFLQLAVSYFVSIGFSNQAIADRLGISLQTAKNHIRRFIKSSWLKIASSSAFMFRILGTMLGNGGGTIGNHRKPFRFWDLRMRECPLRCALIRLSGWLRRLEGQLGPTQSRKPAIHDAVTYAEESGPPRTRRSYFFFCALARAQRAFCAAAILARAARLSRRGPFLVAGALELFVDDGAEAVAL